MTCYTYLSKFLNLLFRHNDENHFFLLGYNVIWSINLFYLRIPLIPFDTLPNELDKETSNIMVDMWSNFATYGKPIPSPDEMFEGGKKKLETLVISFKRIFPL